MDFRTELQSASSRLRKAVSMLIKSLVVVLFVICLDTAHAHDPQDGAIHAVLGPLSYATHEFGPGRVSEFINGFGLSTEADLDKNGGLEISVFYNPKLFRIERDGLVLEETSKRIHIVLGYRHWFNPWISIGGGFFSSYSMGDTHIRRNDFAPDSAPTTTSRSPSNYGIDISTQVEFWRSPNGKLAFVIDTRYSYALSRNENESSSHFGALVGAKYSIQSSNESDTRTTAP